MHQSTQNTAGIILFRRTFFTLIALLSGIVAMLSTGCEKKTTEPEDTQDLNTPEYFEEVLYYNESLQRWIFLNWLGTNSDGGALIVLRVHDLPSEVPSDFNKQAAEDALDYARDAWVNTLRSAGISVRTITCNTSDCRLNFTPAVKIDVWYRSELTNNYAGLCTHQIDMSSKKFYDCTVQITTGLNSEGYKIVTTHELGHALGIASPNENATNHSSNINDVMYKAARYWQLTKGDQSTIRRIYKTEPYIKPADESLAKIIDPKQLVKWQQYTTLAPAR
ncbi:MAG TPA: hypothetical protein PLF13_10410 [candidate division Zixibacteria bacterium]|nr:hypothetical protein [candidate division Zixibacteria bacterium]